MSAQDLLNINQHHKIDIDCYGCYSGEEYYDNLRYEEMSKNNILKIVYDRDYEVEKAYKEIRKLKNELSYLRMHSKQQCLYCIQWIPTAEMNTLCRVKCCNECLQDTSITCRECHKQSHYSERDNPFCEFCSKECMSKWKCVDICAGSGDTECVCNFELGKSYVHDEEWMKV